MKSGKVVVMLQGRHAGKKAVIVRQVCTHAALGSGILLALGPPG